MGSGVKKEHAARLQGRLLGIDIGGTLAKVAYVIPDDGQRPARSKSIPFQHDGKAYLCASTYFQTTDINDFIKFVRDNNLIAADRTLRVTGGGAFKFEKQLEEELQVKVFKVDEMASVMGGLSLVAHIRAGAFYYDLTKGRRVERDVLTAPYPCLVVNIGSGVSILKADGENDFKRVSGTCIGGGTAFGLCKLCFGAESFEEVVKLSVQGSDVLDLSVQHLIGDTAGSSMLPTDTLASSFGRLYAAGAEETLVIKREDIARSAIKMVSYNIGYLAVLMAQVHNVNRIFFSGKYISDHDFTMKTITQAVLFYSLYNRDVGKRDTMQSASEAENTLVQKKLFAPLVAEMQRMDKRHPTFEALFLKHDGYLGALGTLLID